MKIKSLIAVAAALCFAILSFGCGGATNSTTNTTVNKTGNSSTTTTTTTTSTATNTTAPANTASANTGVAECDEYITKYEACLTTIAAKAPQAAPALKSSFETQRDAFTKAASTAAGKAALAPQCKSAIAAAKTSTAQWCSNW